MNDAQNATAVVVLALAAVVTWLSSPAFAAVVTR